VRVTVSQLLSLGIGTRGDEIFHPGPEIVATVYCRSSASPRTRCTGNLPAQLYCKAAIHCPRRLIVSGNGGVWTQMRAIWLSDARQAYYPLFQVVPLGAMVCRYRPTPSAPRFVTPMRTLDQFKVVGRSALVTGAASGLGLAYAEVMVEAGARVTLADIDAEGAAREAARLRAEGHAAARAVACDVSNLAQVAAAFDGHVEAFGGL